MGGREGLGWVRMSTVGCGLALSPCRACGTKATKLVRIEWSGLRAHLALERIQALARCGSPCRQMSRTLKCLLAFPALARKV